MQHTVYLGLGSNIGDRRRTIDEAVRRLGSCVGEVVKQSSVVETEPWGFVSTHRFLNICVACHTTLQPLEVLKVTQQIEREMGRKEKSKGGVYHDRTIDIDILLYDQVTMSTPELTLPHPHMYERDFVMIPLREILPM